MKKWIIPLIMALILMTFVSARMCDEVVEPNRACNLTTPVLSSCENFTYEILNEEGTVGVGNLTLLNSSVYYLTFNETAGRYLVVLCDNSSREIYVEGEDDMAGVAVMFFSLVATALFFVTPFVISRFTKSDMTNLIIKRGMIGIGVWLMTLNAAIAASISDFAGLGLNTEMFSYMWIFGWGGYLFLIFFFIKTLFDATEMWKEKKRRERMGEMFE